VWLTDGGVAAAVPAAGRLQEPGHRGGAARAPRVLQIGEAQNHHDHHHHDHHHHHQHFIIINIIISGSI
jgi:hypothetical protein